MKKANTHRERRYPINLPESQNGKHKNGKGEGRNTGKNLLQPPIFILHWGKHRPKDSVGKTQAWELRVTSTSSVETWTGDN